VYLTLGTIFNRTDGIMQRLIDGAGLVDADALVTVGENGRVPESAPDNVQIETYVPQESLYPNLSAIVCHAGFGTVFGAIAHGLPVGCVPIAADQRTNAGLISAAGAGVNLATAVPDGGLFPALGPGEPDPALVAATIERLLHDVSLRERANELRAELRTGISQSDAADLVENVVADAAPVPRR
jgi:UDP:flavonoid glycosyltransferase YjiC (YdhE family)